MADGVKAAQAGTIISGAGNTAMGLAGIISSVAAAAPLGATGLVGLCANPVTGPIVAAVGLVLLIGGGIMKLQAKKKMKKAQAQQAKDIAAGKLGEKQRNDAQKYQQDFSGAFNKAIDDWARGNKEKYAQPLA